MADIEKLRGKGKIIVRKAVIHGIYAKTLVDAIEAMSNSIADDARELYGKRRGFNSTIKKEIKDGKHIVKTVIRYWPYHYDFEWNVIDKHEKVELELIAFTPKSWIRSMFGWYDGLYGLVELQWAGMTEFCLGFVQGCAQGCVMAKKGGNTHGKRK